jgi:hypothetical protein
MQQQYVIFYMIHTGHIPLASCGYTAYQLMSFATICHALSRWLAGMNRRPDIAINTSYVQS